MKIFSLIIFIALNIHLIYTDWTQRELENLPLVLIFLISVMKLIFHFDVSYIYASLLFSLPLYILYIINPNLIGGGDIKYLFVSGLYLGFLTHIISWYIMLFICCIWLLILKCKKSLEKNMTIPLGSFIGVGNILVSLYLLV